MRDRLGVFISDRLGLNVPKTSATTIPRFMRDRLGLNVLPKGDDGL